MSFVTHLTCWKTGQSVRAGQLANLSPAGKPLRVHYDLSRAAAGLTPEIIVKRGNRLWSWRELLPLPFDIDPPDLGEGGTPLIPADRLARELGMQPDPVMSAGRIWIKDESLNPTGSFKSRGMAVAVAMAKALGARTLAVPSAGNAGGALAAYAAAHGLEAHIFMPSDVPVANRLECELYGAHVTLVDGLITDCAARVRAGCADHGWFDMSTLREPYRVEGKKTMGLELALQLALDRTLESATRAANRRSELSGAPESLPHSKLQTPNSKLAEASPDSLLATRNSLLPLRLPDVIVYPTGGGTGLIGMAKAFDELEAIGWIGPHRPRFVAVQAEGCRPLVRAFHAGQAEAAEHENAQTVAAGLRVPKAIGDFIMLDILRGAAATATSGNNPTTRSATAGNMPTNRIGTTGNNSTTGGAASGTAIAIGDAELLRDARALSAATGICACPEGGACLSAIRKLRQSNWIKPTDEVVLFNTATGLKYSEAFSQA